MADRVHYRMRRAGRIVAWGCGASGMTTSLRTEDWQQVTCANCKRSKEWRFAASQLAGDPTKEGNGT